MEGSFLVGRIRRIQPLSVDVSYVDYGTMGTTISIRGRFLWDYGDYSFYPWTFVMGTMGLWDYRSMGTTNILVYGLDIKCSL
jgi:hypothetical protein